MRYALLLAIAMVSTTQAADDASWSAPVNGLRARLSVLPPTKPDAPFCRVYIEFENVSDVLGQKKIRFDPGKLTLAVADQSGKKLAADAHGSYSATVPTWQPMLLPMDGALRFRISFPGLGCKLRDNGVIVDMGPGRSWIIPQDGSTYRLSGAFTIEKEKGEIGSNSSRLDWSGTLTLPGATIPKG
jgi:hypothetical protein